jgi:ABC-type glycerol-3-phosphate transport system substrate-binding protein
MNFKTTLVTLALAMTGVAASAATTGSLVYHDSTNTVTPYDPATDLIPGVVYYSNFSTNFDNVDTVDYHFTVGGTSNLSINGNDSDEAGEYASQESITLFTAAGMQVGSPFSFANSDVTTAFSNVAAGSYYAEVTSKGAVGSNGLSYEIYLGSDIGTGPLPAVPEPANMALLLAGLGLMGFMAKRRARQ